MVTDVVIIPGIAVEVVSLARVKKHLRIEQSFEEDDDLIQSYIDSAIVQCENYIGGHILPKDMVIKLTGFDNPLVFEAFPVKSITSVAFLTPGTEEHQLLPVENYALTSEYRKRFSIRFKNELPLLQDCFDAVIVTIAVGMEVIEKPIISAILLLVADLYERREDRSEVFNTAAMALLRPYKKF